jgi:hypothetical protein
VKLPDGIPEEAVPFLQQVGYLDDDPVLPGRAAPVVTLLKPSGDEVSSAGLWAKRPAVLIFGSYT